jgi:hypothetical protein
MKNLKLLKNTILTLLLALEALHAASITHLTPSAKFSVLTCSPGSDLYSLFGHSAFRLQDTLGGEPVDIVFNYGVFDAFDDGFYVKFARGKLDYRLQAEYFKNFLHGYALEGRGVWEQELNLTPLQKQRLFELLQENVQEENCVYRYDFFMDNCSSRIRDMIMRATASEPTDRLRFRYVPLDTLMALSGTKFKHPCKEGTTYRQAIQKYLDYQPWSDFGIDIALGRPCDRVIGDFGFMFLPDSLLRELEAAEIDGQKLCEPPVEILPNKTSFSISISTSPLVVFTCWLVIHVCFFFRRKMNPVFFKVSSQVLLVVTGITSLLVLFLWFLTDHTTTQQNWNLLWASPFNLILLLRYKKWMRPLLWIQVATSMLTVGAFLWLPQSLHVAVLPLALMLIITYSSIYRNSRIIDN